jgi:hypothetical protein
MTTMIDNTAITTLPANQQIPVTTNICCDACLEPCDTTKAIQLCENKECSHLCSECISQYFDVKLNTFAICLPQLCPGKCNQIIPRKVWKDHAKPEVSKKYSQMLLSRLSIRCPSCHNQKEFAGHAKVVDNKIVPTKRQASCQQAVQPIPSSTIYPSYYTDSMKKKMVEHHDLTVAKNVVTNYIQDFGETKEALGAEPFSQFLNDCATIFSDDVEKFASHFQAFVQINPHILTGCCKAKVCFQCSVKGWHEDNGGSCLTHSLGKNLDILPCPNCKTSLVKTEGCRSVQCTMCSHKFEWKRSSGRSWLRRMRGSGENIPQVGTIRGNYVRTQFGWAPRVRVEKIAVEKRV